MHFRKVVVFVALVWGIVGFGVIPFSFRDLPAVVLSKLTNDVQV